MQLPIDPLRVLGGIATHWWWMAALVVIGTGVGIFAGMAATQQRYTISAALMRKGLPVTVQTSAIGKSFAPTELNDATLLTTLFSLEPIAMAAKKCGSNLEATTLRAQIEAQQLDETNVFYITYHSTISPNDAMCFTRQWAQEICAYSKRIQRAEAVSAIKLLSREVQGYQQQIDAANQSILDFTMEHDLIGGQSKVDSIVAKLSNAEASLQLAEADAEAKKKHVVTLIKQIRKQSKPELRLREAQDELAQLLSNYTMENPLVKAKIQSIEHTRRELEQLKDEDPSTQLNAYTGTPLGDEIYLKIMETQSQLVEIESRIESIKKTRDEAMAQLTLLPAHLNRYQSLIRNRDSLLEGFRIMKNRLKEAEIFADNAPGYWQIYLTPDRTLMEYSSTLKKPILLGFAGGAFSGFLCLVVAGVLSQINPHRSVMECCSRVNAPLIGALSISQDGNIDDASTNKVWMQSLEPLVADGPDCLIWTGGLSEEGENHFWNSLGSAILKDTGHPLTVINLNHDVPLSPDESCKVIGIEKREAEQENLQLYRVHKVPSKQTRDRIPEEHIWLTCIENSTSGLNQQRAQSLAATPHFGPCGGTIVLHKIPKQRPRQVLENLSLKITEFFSKNS